MATIVISAIAGGAKWGTFWTIAATSAAAYLDAAVIIPKLFPPKGQTFYGQRLNEFNIQNTNEGAVIPRILGTNCRLPASVIWFAGLGKKANFERVVKHKKNKTKWYTYHYYLDLACAVCEGPGQIKKIYANKKLLYEFSEPIVINSNQLSVIRRHFRHLYIYMDIISPQNGPDLSQIKIGTITISGFTNSQNNGTFECISSIKLTNGTTFIRIKNPNCVYESAGASVNLTNFPVEYRSKSLGGIRLYDGTQTQPDTLIKSYEGDDIPSYKGIVYFVLQDFYITDEFYNQCPSFEVLVSQK